MEYQNEHDIVLQVIYIIKNVCMSYETQANNIFLFKIKLILIALKKWLFYFI